MLSLLRRLKLSFMLFNFFHKKQLAYNLQGYKALGLKKKYFSPVSTKDFLSLYSNAQTTMPSEEAMLSQIKATSLFNKLEATDKQSVLHFHQNGFASIKHYLNEKEVTAINDEIDKLLQSKTVKPLANGKIMFACRHSKLVNALGNNAELKQLLTALLGGSPVLFQSINFSAGSEQHTHSDSIHMTTYPQGGLLGVWFALEDITADNGPLHYYPGSHKLPYYMNGDYNNEGSRWLTGNKTYAEYENMIAEKIKQYQIKKEVFLASKGDIFIWHANLFHGGEQHLNKAMTRKSMVLHFFRRGDICYHEITQRPALMYQLY